jgi:Plasmid replication region DNA-binding N-term
MHSENDEQGSGPKETFTGRDILYREGAVGLLDVQRAADALLRQGRKPSVAAIREHLGGGSPNTITPLLAKYWEKLGSRLGDGPESLERVPEALARVTELLWRRALEEARQRLKLLQSSETPAAGMEELQEQLGKLSIALAETRAREGEQLTHLARLSKDREGWRAERGSLLAILKSTQSLLQQSEARIDVLQRQLRDRGSPARPSKPASTKNRKTTSHASKRKGSATVRRKRKSRKPK